MSGPLSYCCAGCGAPVLRYPSGAPCPRVYCSRECQGKHRSSDVRRTSPARLFELYAAAGSGYPSVGALAKRLGVSRECLRKRLLEVGISIRTQAQQARIDYRAGRVVPPRGPGDPGLGVRTAESCRGVPRPPGVRAAVSRARSGRVEAACAWCGCRVLCPPSRVARTRLGVFCGRACQGQGWAHERRCPDAPRPRLVALLLDELLPLAPLERANRLQKRCRDLGLRPAEEEEVSWRLLQEPWRP
jgi:hypothetical protein